MADGTRRRRNAPATEGGGRRRRGVEPPQQPSRRRRRGAEDPPETAGAADPYVAEEPQTGAPPASPTDSAAVAEERPSETSEPEPTEPEPTEPEPTEPEPTGSTETTDSPSSTRSTTVATEVTLPQLGESVTEGTITAWLVEVGDTVEADQPLFELSSDKIDTEVPAPTAGVLTEIKVQVDETVDVGTVVAIIGGAQEGGGGGTDADDGAAEDAEQESSADGGQTVEESTQDQTEVADDRESSGDAPAAGTASDREEVAREAVDDSAGVQEPDTATPGEARTDDESTTETSPSSDGGGGGGALSSPLVRRLAAENDIDLSTVKGTGEGGRITRDDVEAAIGSGTRQPAGASQPAPADAGDAKAEPAQEQPAAKQATPQRRKDATPKATPQPQRRPGGEPGSRTRVEDLSRIRQRIAAKMMESLESSAQLTTVQEVDITKAMAVRARVKDQFKEREGVSLSPFVFLCHAAVMAIRNHPKINAQADWNTGRVTFHDYVNLGIAVDTEKGLLVPNVKGADDLSLAGLSRAISDVANRARGKGKLEMQDIEGGTFTVTNTGSVGVLIDTPILNYPEVAILGTGAVKKRPVVLDGDGGPAIAMRDMLYLSLTYDHRLIDGADAARFVTEVKDIVETHDWDAEIGY